MPSKPKVFEPAPAESPKVIVPLPNEVTPDKPVYTSTGYELLPSAMINLAVNGVIESGNASEVGPDNPVRFTVPLPDTTTLPPTSSIVINIDI